MGAPSFLITTDVVTSVRQYFQWESTEGLTWTVTGSDAAINGVYEYIGQSQYYDMVLKYHRDTTDSTKIFITSEYSGEYRAIFGTTSDDPIASEDAWPSYIHTDMVFGDEALTEYWYENQNDNSYTLPPTFGSASTGTGLFSWQLDANGWSANASDDFVELTGLADSESHTLYVREKLQDESYTDSAEQAFTVTFDNGSMAIIQESDSVTTDLTSFTVNFAFPSYESKMLSGLTTDLFDLMGLWTYCGVKNGQAGFIRDDRYLWYDTSTDRWVVTSLNYYDGTYTFDDYYYSFMYANTTGTAFTSTGWSSGMEADMGQIAGTITWSSDVYAIMPIGSNTARYRVDGGAWINLDQDAVSFELNLSLGNSYSVEIQELLENGLYTDSATVNITCALIPAPTVGMTGGVSSSDGGRNVTLQWSSNASDTADFVVAGTGTFRYRVNSGPWSDETILTEALQMFQLPTGDNLVEIEEKSANDIWGSTGSFTLTVTNGAETGSGDSGITVPDGKYLVVLNPATGNEFLWDGVADLSDLEPLTE